MLELTKPPAAADRPVSALDCGKPVSLVHCCPFAAGASLVLAAGDAHATLLSVKPADDGRGELELKRVDRALPVVGPVDAAAWGESGGQLRLVTVGPGAAVLHVIGDEPGDARPVAMPAEAEEGVTAVPRGALRRVHAACLVRDALALTGDDCRAHFVPLAPPGGSTLGLRAAAANMPPCRSLLLGAPGVAVTSHPLEPHHVMVADEGRLLFVDLRAPPDTLPSISRELPAAPSSDGYALRDADWCPADPNLVGGVLNSGNWVAWDLRQGGEVQSGDAHAHGGLAFAWAPTGRRFATTGRLGDVAVHNVTPGSVAGFGGDSRWTVPAQALTHGMPTRTAALSWARGGATTSSSASILVGACDTKVCVWSVAGGGSHMAA